MTEYEEGTTNYGSAKTPTFVPPTGDDFGGKKEFKSPKQPYDHFMDEERVPIYRKIGIEDVRDLDLGEWARIGGRGAYIQLLGTEELWGMHVIEIPPGASLEIEQHIYEKILYVVEGMGTTEVWRNGGPAGSAPQTFEWGDGSLFGIPLNTPHRLINGSSKRALLIAGTTAPAVFNMYDNRDFIFKNPYPFDERYSGGSDFFDYRDELLTDPVRGRAMQVTNLIPDLPNLKMPLDNQRGAGTRRIQPWMANARFYMKVLEFQVGRYTPAHYHPPSAVLICIKGGGFTYTWPREAGLQPWEVGNGDLVQRVDYGPGGMVAAAPGGGDWVHQHFATSAEPLRVLAMNGPPSARIGGLFAPPGATLKSSNLGMSDGGRSIEYWNEDPRIRADFEAALAQNGTFTRMQPELYERPAGQ
ncbi:cupin domain-containing protein [Aeromicrobium wangtongii]|uniref:cupin domain-containing protein n=1 Tax=Aeromicrobium wangtongii TaxID=2969247 RepID=UPI002016CF25|nr:cupin domain-containing protein [Aeromicrobium wangtongii]MCL3817651.1 cupin domain-containing protein [Aeromicrobium wangtongii]